MRKKWLLMFDEDDYSDAKEIVKGLKSVERTGFAEVLWEGDIGVGENVEDKMKEYIKDCDVVFYVFSANSDTTRMIELSKRKKLYGIYVKTVANFVMDYVAQHNVKIVPNKPFSDIGWLRGMALTINTIIGKKSVDLPKFKVLLFWNHPHMP